MPPGGGGMGALGQGVTRIELVVLQPLGDVIVTVKMLAPVGFHVTLTLFPVVGEVIVPLETDQL